MAEPEIAAAEIPPSTELDASALAPEPIATAPDVDESAPALILEVLADEALKEDDGGESKAKRQRVDDDAGGIASFSCSLQTMVRKLEDVFAVLIATMSLPFTRMFCETKPCGKELLLGWCSHWSDSPLHLSSMNQQTHISVGVLIGKYGETIKNLQINSGAKNHQLGKLVKQKTIKNLHL
ncbi:hypothetical protein J5N97_016491 [Dioscorea zingiberensis]|uniref:K Homology domain-containing protein n=1 Tax=Dioscorea zingiberensis TaxID=325984 RepID=A0A9D5CJG7_9LILI|nr:hypothetical protein J5N97_016491 [Dioscorea zingiberensis]